MQTFEELDCWKACRELRLYTVKTLVRGLPREERYRLEDLFTEGELEKARTLVQKAVALLNGYMAYLKRAAKQVHEDAIPYETIPPNNDEQRTPPTNQ